MYEALNHIATILEGMENGKAENKIVWPQKR
jgi:hypothetical protein